MKIKLYDEYRERADKAEVRLCQYCGSYYNTEQCLEYFSDSNYYKCLNCEKIEHLERKMEITIKYLKLKGVVE